MGSGVSPAFSIARAETYHVEDFPILADTADSVSFFHIRSHNARRISKKLSRNPVIDLPGDISLFEVELSSIEPFRNLVKALAAVLYEGCFNIDEARISLLGMDSSHVAMVDFELPSSFFDRYLCEGTPKIFINIGEFLKFLDRVERDEMVKIKLDEDRARLMIQCHSSGANSQVRDAYHGAP